MTIQQTINTLIATLSQNPDGIVEPEELEQALVNLATSYLNLNDHSSLLGLNAFDPTKSYGAGQCTVRNGRLYQALKTTTQGAFHEAEWIDMFRALEVDTTGFEGYDNQKVYNKTDRVVYQLRLFESVDIDPMLNIPPVDENGINDPLKWTEISADTGKRNAEPWTPGIYKPNKDIITHEKEFYQYIGPAELNSTDIAAEIDEGYWQKLGNTLTLVNALTSSNTTAALTANQGKTLKNLIDNLVNVSQHVIPIADEDGNLINTDMRFVKGSNSKYLEAGDPDLDPENGLSPVNLHRFAIRGRTSSRMQDQGFEITLGGQIWNDLILYLKETNLFSGNTILKVTDSNYSSRPNSIQSSINGVKNFLITENKISVGEGYNNSANGVFRVFCLPNNPHQYFFGTFDKTATNYYNGALFREDDGNFYYKENGETKPFTTPPTTTINFFNEGLFGTQNLGFAKNAITTTNGIGETTMTNSLIVGASLTIKNKPYNANNVYIRIRGGRTPTGEFSGTGNIYATLTIPSSPVQKGYSLTNFLQGADIPQNTELYAEVAGDTSKENFDTLNLSLLLKQL